jgi:Carbohydrate-selective porin, OprB family
LPNAAGGIRCDATALGMAGADLTLLLRRLVGSPRPRAFLFLLGTHGGAAQLGTWLAAQTDMQYVIHPGGLRDAHNALVLGLRVAITTDTQ